MERLEYIRNQELASIKAGSFSKAIIDSALSAAPSVVAVVTLGIYALLGDDTIINIYNNICNNHDIQYRQQFGCDKGIHFSGTLQPTPLPADLLPDAAEHFSRRETQSGSPHNLLGRRRDPELYRYRSVRQ